MSIRFTCACGEALVALDVFAGGQIKCATCEEMVPVPVPVHSADEHEKIHFPCPHCSKRLLGRKASIGKLSRCPACEGVYVVPRPEGLPPSAFDNDNNKGWGSEDHRKWPDSSAHDQTSGSSTRYDIDVNDVMFLPGMLDQLRQQPQMSVDDIQHAVIGRKEPPKPPNYSQAQIAGSVSQPPPAAKPDAYQPDSPPTDPKPPTDQDAPPGTPALPTMNAAPTPLTPPLPPHFPLPNSGPHVPANFSPMPFFFPPPVYFQQPTPGQNFAPPQMHGYAGLPPKSLPSAPQSAGEPRPSTPDDEPFLAAPNPDAAAATFDTETSDREQFVAVLRLPPGELDADEVRLNTRLFIIGRERDCHLQLPSNSINRHHCVIKQDEFMVRIRDMGTETGTYVNGMPCRGEMVLSHGDTIRVGDTKMQLILSKESIDDQSPFEAFPVMDDYTVF